MPPSSEISPDANQLSIHDLARGLGIDRTIVRRNVRAGMPRSSIEAAKEWRALYVRPRARSERPSAPGGDGVRIRPTEEAISTGRTQAPKVVDFFGTDGLSGEELEDSIPRLRRLEKATALALERALKADNVTAAVALRREHCTALRTFYNVEEKKIKIDQARGRLVSVERALGMIDEAMKAAILTLRRLPDLGRDPAERARLEAFLNTVLNETKAGAERGFKGTRPSSEGVASG